jgi:hypothetical protein
MGAQNLSGAIPAWAVHASAATIAHAKTRQIDFKSLTRIFIFTTLCITYKRDL